MIDAAMNASAFHFGHLARAFDNTNGSRVARVVCANGTGRIKRHIAASGAALSLHAGIAQSECKLSDLVCG
jgi:hypothetical protein